MNTTDTTKTASAQPENVSESVGVDRVFYVNEWQWDAICNLQAARVALNGHRDKPTIRLADKWISEAIESLKTDSQP